MQLNIGASSDDRIEEVKANENKNEIPSKNRETSQVKMVVETQKKQLQLNESVKSLDAGTLSCELNSKGLKVAREDFEID